MKKILNQIFICTGILAIVGLAYPTQLYALSVASRIGDQSTEVIRGDRLYFEVEIKYPENPHRADLRINYEILQDGEVVADAQVLRAVETQASFLDYIVVPKSAMSGVHDLRVSIESYDGTLDESVSVSFKVLKGADQVTTYFFILLGVIVLVGVLLMLQMFFFNRNRGNGRLKVT